MNMGRVMQEERRVILSRSSLLPLGVAAALMVGTATGTWAIASAMGKVEGAIDRLEGRVSKLEHAISEGMGAAISRRSFRLWLELLRRLNTGINLVVPDMPE
jgi:hypothetical protein